MERARLAAFAMEMSRLIVTANLRRGANQLIYQERLRRLLEECGLL